MTKHTKTYYGVDMEGKYYKTKDLNKFYNENPKICIITDGISMIHAKYQSWHAPAYIHAIQPDARIGRTIKDTIKTIKSKEIEEI